ncbi:hypothetical protein FGSG_13886 [Fusarium graminearum PH-1]|uniref:hypothetical protein n=1 Tax=Gibberella zeae (strain ATCC MYA-4620 / CBS 123657 / FGSC 9075 / NRRL 31084 / PH-1) TaxID=229533 RepID=UPI00021F268D|nr:hypothetical protein FGSG_13886 [Fusarium graminearum PH-1]ESU17821.1 hypothetical protein FGSG_13886 [Fusarium graminearum PH-1]|eukprot:XP_011325443.1 hypothetical protein FGSG_13886 [Fusarium graminearum PH-1]
MTSSIVEALANVQPPETPDSEDHDIENETQESPQPTNEPSLDDPQIGKPISHGQIVDLWKRSKAQDDANYTLEQLLRGASVYIPPPPPKPEPLTKCSLPNTKPSWPVFAAKKKPAPTNE